LTSKKKLFVPAAVMTALTGWKPAFKLPPANT
jgi:hypothetical protein